MAAKLPDKGFTKAEKQWLEQVIQDIAGAKAIQGQNTTVDSRPDGQTINAQPPTDTTNTGQ